ncbi:MAG: hypothetical protein HN509_08970 [Halobacteriovoraceae bacterium]|jgi:hypothetical protein|nr:hypothetical protein [Halobacteriovoraceae bacterium]MBT5094225.1 hypothetical protein [Halobacteriovoraceae bacterium]
MLLKSKLLLFLISILLAAGCSRQSKRDNFRKKVFYSLLDLQGPLNSCLYKLEGEENSGKMHLYMVWNRRGDVKFVKVSSKLKKETIACLEKKYRQAKWPIHYELREVVISHTFSYDPFLNPPKHKRLGIELDGIASIPKQILDEEDTLKTSEDVKKVKLK